MSRAAGALARLAEIASIPDRGRPGQRSTCLQPTNVPPAGTASTCTRRCAVCAHHSSMAVAARNSHPRVLPFSPRLSPAMATVGSSARDDDVRRTVRRGLEIVTRIIEAAGRTDRWRPRLPRRHPASRRSRSAPRRLRDARAGQPREPGRQEVWRALVDLGTTHRQFDCGLGHARGRRGQESRPRRRTSRPPHPVDLSVDLFDHRPRL